MRIVITAGGTGGHINPALVVAKEFKKMNNTVLFVGGLYGPEEKMAADAGIDFLGINVRGLDRSSIVGMLKAILIFPLAVLRAMSAFSVFRPDTVIGAGGYASAPSVVAASLRSIPLFLMEQNVYPGLVTRKMGAKALKVFTSFDATKNWLKRSNLKLSGNPVRSGFYFNAGGSSVDGKRVLFVIGGSQGAHSVNTAVAEALPILKEKNLKIYHQTGDADFELIDALYKKHGIESVVKPFFDNVNEVMREANLAVARAGASTCAELNLSGLPAIFVPYPGAGGHQKLNAHALELGGAAVTIDDDILEGSLLAKTIDEILGDDEKLALMSANSREMARPDAGSVICEEIIEMLEG